MHLIFKFCNVNPPPGTLRIVWKVRLKRSLLIKITDVMLGLESGEGEPGAGGSVTETRYCKDWVLLEYKGKSINGRECIS